MSADLAAHSLRLKRNKALESLIDVIYKKYSLLVNVGIEIEFYLPGEQDIEKLEIITNFKFSKEKGQRQYEINTQPTTDLLSLIAEVQNFIKTLTLQTSGTILFEPKPYTDCPGNSLHFHLNMLHAVTGVEIFANGAHIEHCASWLCHLMLSTFLVFAPQEKSYTRFVAGYMAPTHVSFGGNNRTTALRIPSSLPKRLEHRIAQPLVDLYLALFVLIKSIYLSLENPYPIIRQQKIYGNAYDEQYALIPFPPNIWVAEELFDASFFAVKT